MTTANTLMGTLGVVLAGGTSRRFGADKSTAMLGGVPLLERVIARSRPQVDDLVISGAAQFRGKLPLIPDAMPGEGPLAAVCTCLCWARERGFQHVVTFPCDVPFFPDDTVAQLRRALERGGDGAMVRSAGRGHYAFSLWPVSSLPRLTDAVTRGIRSLRGLEPVAAVVYAEMPAGDGPGGDPFFNINRPEDLEVAESWLSQAHRPASGQR